VYDSRPAPPRIFHRLSGGKIRPDRFPWKERVLTDTIRIDPDRFAEAVAFAARGHADQGRKRAKSDPRPLIPYLSHLLGVAGLVIEDGGDADEAIAGLLHDYIEDVD